MSVRKVLDVIKHEVVLEHVRHAFFERLVDLPVRIFFLVRHCYSHGWCCYQGFMFAIIGVFVALGGMQLAKATKTVEAESKVSVGSGSRTPVPTS